MSLNPLSATSGCERVQQTFVHSITSLVVASSVGGITDQIEDGQSGTLVEPDDLEALGRAVTALVNDRESAARMGAAARSRIREQFLGPRHLMQQGRLIRSLL